MFNMSLLATIADVDALTAPLGVIWAAVLAIGVSMIGYRIAKRAIGRF
jgi:hypothetical protein